jgi:hypothetical protein
MPTVSAFRHANDTDTAAVISPLEIAGCKVWLRAESEALNDADAVGTWTDLSGNGNNETQATAGNKPVFKAGIINNHAVMRFTAANSSKMNTSAGIIATTAARTLIVAYRHTRLTSTAGTVAGEGTVNANSVQFYIQDRDDISGAAPYLLMGTVDIAAGYPGQRAEWKIVAASWAGGTAGATKLFVGQTLAAQSTATLIAATDGLRVGYNASNEYFNGDIAEIIYYDTQLSIPNTLKVVHYLQREYGINYQ